MAVHRSRDGRRIVVRPLLATDRDELASRYDELSAAARRARFGSAPDRLGARELDQLLDLDYDDRFALAAVVEDAAGERGVGVARYVRHRDDPATAEVAVVVLDAEQRQGIGTFLLHELVEVARRHGITKFTATVDWENSELLDGIRAAGGTVGPAEPGVAGVTFELSGA
jgi:GNAT superfamily N-acetyltransferase